MIEYLRKHGLRITPQRRELLKILKRLGKYHPSFTEICEAMSKAHPNVSQSTILTNLVAFEDIGLVRSFSFRGETRYDLNPRPHVNIIDSRGKIVDVEDDEIEQILNKLVEKVRKKAGVIAKRLLVIIE